MGAGTEREALQAEGERYRKRGAQRDRESAPGLAVTGGTPAKEKGGRGKQSAGQQEASNHPASGREACFLSNRSGKTCHSSGLDDEMVNKKQESAVPQASHLNVIARVLEIWLNYLLCWQTPNYEHKDQINGK